MLGRRCLGIACAVALGGCLSGGDDDTSPNDPDAATSSGADASVTPDAAPADDSVLFFFGEDATNGRELWITDGTADGTRMVADINPGAADGAATLSNFLVRDGDDVFFRGDDGTTGLELWISDGTEAGTRSVGDVNPDGGSSAASVFRFGDEVLFAADDGVNGRELWAMTGSSVRLVADIDGTAANSSPGQFVEYQGSAYFTATTPATGTELYVYDGTDVTVAADLDPGAPSGLPLTPLVFGDKLIFSARTADAGRELWSYDGKAAAQLDDIAVGVTASDPENFTVFGAQLVFTATVDADEELYVTDGSVGGAMLAANINPDGTGRPFRFVPLDGVLLFIADDGNGHEWMTWDGAQVTKLIDINPAGASFPVPIAVVDDLLYFTADDGTTRRMWVTDGTAAGTRPLADVIGVELDNFCDTILGGAGGKLIFSHDLELYISDSTPAGTAIVPGVSITDSKCG